MSDPAKRRATLYGDILVPNLAGWRRSRMPRVAMERAE
jgi:hypothetical protein